jgi:ABC-2 type transport system permease protein
MSWCSRSAIGSRMTEIDRRPVRAFIVPGCHAVEPSESISNGSLRIYLPKWSGTIYEVLSAPVSPW